MTSKLTKFLGAAGAAALMGWAGQALAMEGPTPYLPGISVGTPAGALPPPGFYFGDINTVITNGPIEGNSGNQKAPGNLGTYLNIPTVAWSTGWQILGAQHYVMALTQPYVLQSSNVAGAPGMSNGAFNTIFSPINLGWDLGDFHAKAGLGIYADDGYNQTIVSTSGATAGKLVRGGNSAANNFWTFEPDVGLSYLANGWDFTGHVVFDFNTENNDTHYQSGNVFFLDLTAGKNIGKWVVGAGGNFTQQLNCDSGSGNFNGCNQLQQVMIGPFIGYNFGPVEIDAKALFSVHTENGFNANYYYTSFAFPF